MKANIKFINKNKEQLTKEIYTLVNKMNELNRTLGGSETRKEVGEKDFLTIDDRLSSARGGISTHMDQQHYNMKSLSIQRPYKEQILGYSNI